MTVHVTYEVDKILRNNPDTQHDIALKTIEYTYKDDILVRLLISGNIGVDLENKLQSKFSSEQFYAMKTYNQSKIKLMTRDKFLEKLKQFDKHQTVVEHEIFEEYAYTDKKRSL